MDNYMHDTADDDDDDDDDDVDVDDNNDESDGNKTNRDKDQRREKKRRPRPDQETIRKLDLSYKRLTWFRANRNSILSTSASLLKRFLTKHIFEVLKQRLTKEFHSSLLDVIQVGIEHLDSTGGEIIGAACGGVLAPDSESYSTFRPLLHPIICVLQDVPPEKKHPKDDWDLTLTYDIGDPIIDPQNVFVESVAVTISRSIKGYPFLPKMNETHFKKMEIELKKAFKRMTMGPKNGTTAEIPIEDGGAAVAKGSYFTLEGLPKRLERQLNKEGLLFDRSDQGIDTANGYKHWPSGRGIFLIGQTEGNVANNATKKKDVSFVWINESDHIKVMVGRKDGNLYEAFILAYDILNEINAHIAFQRDDDQFGYLTLSPAIIGTGLKASVRLKLPFLGEEPIFRDEICAQHNLECKDAITNNSSVDNFFELSNKRTYALSEANILQEVYRGVREIINIERRYKEP